MSWEAKPASLEAWAQRRGTLEADEVERHLGLDDTDLMFRTLIAELKERHLLASLGNSGTPTTQKCNLENVQHAILIRM